jgi:type II secretion system protein H
MSHPERDSGFTLIELLVAISLLGVMLAIAVVGWSTWSKAREQSGTASQIESILRQTQQRAVTESRTLCVRFESNQRDYSTYTGECDGSPVKIAGPLTAVNGDVRITTPSFTGRYSTGTGVSFYARGTASPGNLKVTRTGSSKVYTVSVEGLTGRVSVS